MIIYTKLTKNITRTTVMDLHVYLAFIYIYKHTSNMQTAQHLINVNLTFSPMETPPDVTITSTLSSADCNLASSEFGLVN